MKAWVTEARLPAQFSDDKTVNYVLLTTIVEKIFFKEFQPPSRLYFSNLRKKNCLRHVHILLALMGTIGNDVYGCMSCQIVRGAYTSLSRFSSDVSVSLIWQQKINMTICKSTIKIRKLKLIFIKENRWQNQNSIPFVQWNVNSFVGSQKKWMPMFCTRQDIIIWNELKVW